MKNKAHPIDRYSFQKDEPFLLDANVWLYLYPAPSDKNTCPAAAYSKALKNLIDAKSLLAMDALVLSEYLNRYCRIEWNALFKTSYAEYKRFRKSSDFTSVGQGAATFARSILRICRNHDHPFSSADITQILSDFESGVNDFNDGLLTETCRHTGWKFITNDGDCTTGGIEVLTANNKLLTACP